ncbi:unnamed protein product [Mytilus coruscus]|uniref:PH domain-containing protein n=1 Tax=Mytilus coruscus TaxID=42192 RepID=A0A6J8EEY0_MYTCO|nr:unnamed protein product [Mytilus coruscus]
MGCLTGCFHSEQGSYDDNRPKNMTNNRSSEVLDWSNVSQFSGYLYKKPFGHPSNKWSKRFFVVKDGYLFYYTEQERKDMEKRKCISIHPKGFIPLGESIISIHNEETQYSAFTICSTELNMTYLLGTESNYDRTKWLEHLEKAQKITWKNAQLMDNMIKQLEDQGLQMAKQKQEYFDKLQSEISALSDEKQKTEELEQINSELAKEKAKLEQYHEDLMKDYEQMKDELDNTIESMKTLEADSAELSHTLQEKDTMLQSLAKDKDRVLTQLQDKENLINREFEDLSQTREELKLALKQIEDDTQALLDDKSVAEDKLQENESIIQQLEEEKKSICDQATELKETIRDLRTQKEMTEAELKEEIVARMAAEKKLRDANISLDRLDTAVSLQTPNINHEIKEEMKTNVKNLKRFFEDLATEAAIDSDKPVIVKNSIHARKTIARRVKTMKLDRRKSNSIRIRSTTIEQVKMKLPRRAATTYMKGPISDSDLQELMNPTSRVSISPNASIKTKVVFTEHL